MLICLMERYANLFEREKDGSLRRDVCVCSCLAATAAAAADADPLVVVVRHFANCFDKWEESVCLSVSVLV